MPEWTLDVLTAQVAATNAETDYPRMRFDYERSKAQLDFRKDFLTFEGQVPLPQMFELPGRAAAAGHLDTGTPGGGSA
jgi:hypothetical protein